MTHYRFGFLLIFQIVLRTCPGVQSADTKQPIRDINLGFEAIRVQDRQFARNRTFPFANVSDVAVNEALGHIFVLQRVEPAVSVWDRTGLLLFAWKTSALGYPHSIKLNGTNPPSATVWITDMAPPLTAGTKYGHCVKQFTYKGDFLGSIGHCSKNGGSSLNPLQFDKVTDIVWDTQGNVYIADGDLGGLNNRIVVLDRYMSIRDVWNPANTPGDGPLKFNLPHSLAVDKCDRVWITDTMNKRVQIVQSNGSYIGEWKCFNDSLIYGIDISSPNSKTLLVMLTAKTSIGEPRLFVLSTELDCSHSTLVEKCSTALKQQLVPSNKTLKVSSGANNQVLMLHSVTLDSVDNSLYISLLPGSISPLKYILAATPPPPSFVGCPKDKNPPKWPTSWNATLLLSTFNVDHLYTGEMVYSEELKAMYVRLVNYMGFTKEFLTIERNNFVIKRLGEDNVQCFQLSNVTWAFPASNCQWLTKHNCTCQGTTSVAGHDLMYWQCPSYQYTEWYWFLKNTNQPWRMFLNNITNPSEIPVLGEFAMINFASYGDNVDILNSIIKACHGSVRSERQTHDIFPLSIHLGAKDVLFNPKYDLQPKIAHQKFPAGNISGFTHSCSKVKGFPAAWPSQFYMTATFLPVNKYNPLPSQILYNWDQRLQMTRMLMSPNVYKALLIGSHTYIFSREPNGSVECIKHLDFGMPNPFWMKTDMCQCMGSITSNKWLSSFNDTVIAVCPLTDNRVFWTWYSFPDEENFRPLVFFETAAPLGEGTDLAFGDYHDFYPSYLLIDQRSFQIPPKCKI